VFLRKADRLDYADAIRLFEMREILKEVLLAIQEIVGDGD
jgi:hypothetical protein